MKRQAVAWETIFAHHIFNKEPYSEYIKNYDNLIRRRQLNYKTGKRFDRHFTKEDIWMATKHICIYIYA